LGDKGASHRRAIRAASPAPLPTLSDPARWPRWQSRARAVRHSSAATSPTLRTRLNWV